MFPLYLFLSSSTMLPFTQNRGGIFTSLLHCPFCHRDPAAALGQVSNPRSSLSFQSELPSAQALPASHLGTAGISPCSSLFLFSPCPSRHTWAWPGSGTQLRSAHACGATRKCGPDTCHNSTTWELTRRNSDSWLHTKLESLMGSGNLCLNRTSQ